MVSIASLKEVCFSKKSSEFSSSPTQHQMTDPPPVEPSDADCCGSGCTPCVWDIHQQELRAWNRRQGGREVSDTEQCLKEETYTEFECALVTQVTPTTAVYKFGLGGNRMLGHKSGQHLVVRGVVEGEAVTRQYSILSKGETLGQFELAVKAYPEGKMSTLVRDWKVGCMVSCRGPFGTFSYPGLNKWSKMVMFAQGTGLVPFIPVIEDILEDEREDTLLRLVYSCQSSEEILLEERLNEFCGFWNFRLKIYLGQETAGSCRVPQREIVRQKLDEQGVEQEVGMCPDKERTGFLVCGSKQFNREMNQRLTLDHGISSDLIHVF